MAIRFDPTASTIIVKLMLEGPKGIRWVKAALDTGASYTLIPWHVAMGLGYDPAISRNRRLSTTVSGTEHIPMIKVGAIETLGKRAEDILVGVHNIPTPARVHALLGLNFLQRFEKLSVYLKEGLVELE